MSHESRTLNDKHCDTCHCDSGSFLAIVPTAYEIYAVASTAKEAKRLALGAALEWLQMGNTQFEPGKFYKTQKQVEEWLGCNVYPLSTFGVGQEG